MRSFSTEWSKIWAVLSGKGYRQTGIGYAEKGTTQIRLTNDRPHVTVYFDGGCSEFVGKAQVAGWLARVAVAPADLA